MLGVAGVGEGISRASAAGALMAAAVLAAGLVVYDPAVIALVVPALAGGLLLIATVRFLCRWPECPHAYRVVLIWAFGTFVAHLVIGLVITAPRLTTAFGPDAILYNHDAAALVQHWLHSLPSPVLPSGKEGYFYLLAVMYWCFGIHQASGIAVNAALFTAVIPLLSDTARRQFGAGAARFVPPIVALFPGFLIWGSQLLREAGVYFLIAVVLNCASRLAQRARLAPVAILALGSALLFTFRADVAFIVTGTIVLGLALGRSAGGRSLASGFGAAALVIALVIGTGVGFSGYKLVTGSSFVALNTVRAGSADEGASGFLPGANISDPVHAAAYLPLGVTYFGLGPFPWKIHGRQIAALPEVLGWWFLLPSAWTGLRVARRRRNRAWLIDALPAVGLLIVLSLLVANFGTALRERVQVILVVVPLMSLGWAERARKTAPREKLTSEGVPTGGQSGVELNGSGTPGNPA